MGMIKNIDEVVTILSNVEYSKSEYGELCYKHRYEDRDKEIVKCEDCKHFWETRLGNFCFKRTTITNKKYVKPENFCSYGERKDDG